jgi:hypothetical protein
MNVHAYLLRMPDLKDYRPANPLIWGAVLAVICAVIVTLTQLTGTPVPENRLLQTPLAAAAPGFFFGWAAANIKNWLGRPR